MTNLPRVVLLVENQRHIGRSLLYGVSAWTREHGPWSFYQAAPFYEPTSWKELLRRIKAWKPDGIILREQGDIDADLLSMGRPLIYSPHRTGPAHGVPNILGDDDEIGTLAATHLLERGFEHFGFCGFETFWWAVDRGRAFARTVEDAGFEVDWYQPPKSKAARHWDREPHAMAEWLNSLPRPCAVFACTDDRNRQLVEGCKEAGLRIPDDIALLGVDNDELVCELSAPPLSSIILNAEASGFEAAAQLDRMMRGLKPQTMTIPIPVPGVAVRQSTDRFAVADPQIRKSLHFMQANCCTGLKVDAIARAAGLSRRVLELRFRKALKRSVGDELLRMRMETARLLLRESDLPISRIAEETGYSEAKHLTRAFRSLTGTTPSAYRNRSGGRKSVP